MAGIHGKNAEIRISTSETLLSGVQLGDGAGGDTALTGTQQFQAISTQRNWRYDSTILIEFSEAAAQGTLAIAAANTDSLNRQTRLINYAAGAVELGPYPAVISGVFVRAYSMELTTVANLVGDARNFTLSVATDTVDTTTMGETWKGFEDGLSGFEGSLDGLYVDEFWYKQAIATLSGVIPRRVLKFVPNPAAMTTYFQGTVIFPSWELSGGHDAAIEHTVPFQGRGPLDHVVAGAPWFNLSEVF